MFVKCFELRKIYRKVKLLETKLYNIHNKSVTARIDCTISIALKSIAWINNFVKSCFLMIETLDKILTGLLLCRREICASCGTLSLDSLVLC